MGRVPTFIRKPRPLTPQSLRELALAYVARFATSEAKLARYLGRKVAERGWDDAALPDIAGVVEAVTKLGFIDDALYAETQARSLTRRGFGRRRVDAAVRAAGIGDAARVLADTVVADNRTASALRFAERKRLGPFAAAAVGDPALRQRQFAAFMRAGHDPAITRTILALPPGADLSVLDEP